MVEETNTPPDSDAEMIEGAVPHEDSPDDAALSEVGSQTDMSEASEKSGGKAGRGALLALVLVALIAAGLYLSWPALQPLMLAQLPQPSNQAMAAVRELDHRMAQLEADNARYAHTSAVIEKTSTEVTKRLDELSNELTNAIPGSDVVRNFGEKFTALEESLSELRQKVKEKGAVVLKEGNPSADLHNEDSVALETFRRQLQAVKSQLTELAGSVAVGMAATPTTVSTAIDVSANVTDLAAENAELRQMVAAMQGNLGKLEKTVAQSRRALLVLQARKSGSLGESLVLAVGQLRQTVLAGRSYEAPLAALSALVAQDAAYLSAIGALTPLAKHGVATLRGLSVQFPSVARAVLRADSAGSSSAGGFIDRTWQRISSLVTIRRIGEIDGAAADAILARVERRLAAGELVAAVDLMASLKGPAGTAGEAWLNRARARLGAESALAALQAGVIARLADG